jgi:hypothetical protein
VLVAVTLCFGEADTIDDRCVIQLVGDDRILFAEEWLEDTAVRIEARDVEDRVLGAQKC